MLIRHLLATTVAHAMTLTFHALGESGFPRVLAAQEALAARDADVVASPFAPNGIVINPFGVFPGPEAIRTFVVVGTSDEVAPRVRALLEAGFWYVISVIFPFDTDTPQLLAERVIPAAMDA